MLKCYVFSVFRDSGDAGLLLELVLFLEINDSPVPLTLGHQEMVETSPDEPFVGGCRHPGWMETEAGGTSWSEGASPLQRGGCSRST